MELELLPATMKHISKRYSTIFYTPGTRQDAGDNIGCRGYGHPSLGAYSLRKEANMEMIKYLSLR